MKNWCRFARNLAISSVAHGGIVLALILGAFTHSCARKDRELVIPTQLVVEVPVEPASAAGPVTPPADQPEPEKSDEAQTALRPEPERSIRKESPPSQLKPEDRIKVSRVRVRRPTSPSERPPRPTRLTAEEIQRLLERGARPSTRASLSDDVLRKLLESDIKLSANGQMLTEEMMYQEMIRQVMYRAWNQPSSVAVEGLTTKMAITFGPGGTITGSRMTESSGNGVMDESVRRAVESVGRISELPPSFIEQHGTVIVAFELTGNGG